MSDMNESQDQNRDEHDGSEGGASDPNKGSDQPSGRPSSRGKRTQRLTGARYLIDYIGGGEYQLSCSLPGEPPHPLGKSDSPTVLMSVALANGIPGDEIAVAPAAALVHFAGMPVGINSMLGKIGTDVWWLPGKSQFVLSAEENDQNAKQIAEAIKKAQAAGENAAPDDSAHDVADGGDASDSSTDDESGRAAPQHNKVRNQRIAGKAQRERRSRKNDRDDGTKGGRIGWTFREIRLEGPRDGPRGETGGDPSSN